MKNMAEEKKRPDCGPRGSNLPKNRYMAFFDHCIFRMAGLHSWYKCRGQTRKCTVTPVLGNVQEPQDIHGWYNRNMPSMYSPNTILWHFDVNGNYWHTDVDPRLQKVIQENIVEIPDFGNFYLDISYFSLERLGEFAPIYQAFRKSAEKITKFLVNNPDIPLPVACFDRSQ